MLEAGHDEDRLARAGHEQTGQPLERFRVVADQVAQVGAGRDQKRVDAGTGCGLGGAAQPVGLQLGHACTLTRRT